MQNHGAATRADPLTPPEPAAQLTQTSLFIDTPTKGSGLGSARAHKREDEDDDMNKLTSDGGSDSAGTKQPAWEASAPVGQMM